MTLKTITFITGLAVLTGCQTVSVKPSEVKTVPIAGFQAPQTNMERRSSVSFERPNYLNRINSSSTVADLDNDGVLEYVQVRTNQEYLEYMGISGTKSAEENMSALRKAKWSESLEFFEVPSDSATKFDAKPFVSKNLAVKGNTSGCLHGVTVLVGDLNADGFLDLVAPCHGFDLRPWPGAISYVFLNNGKGEFISRKLHSDPQFSHRGELADLDNDGDLDIVMAQTNRVAMYRNDGSGNFDSAEIIMKSPGGIGVVGASDFNGDGLTDLAVSGLEDDFNGGGTVRSRIFWNDGSKDFGKGPVTFLPPKKGYGIVIDFLVSDGNLFLVRTEQKRDRGYIGAGIQQIDVKTGEEVGFFSRPGPHPAILHQLKTRAGEEYFGSLEDYRRSGDFYLKAGKAASVYDGNFKK